MGHGQVPGGSGGGGAVQPRPLTLVESVVAVDDTETLLAAASPNRRNLVIQNLGPAIVQIYVTPALGFGGGGIQLTPGSSTVAGDVWSAAQFTGVVQVAVYAICNTGASCNVSVTVET